MDKICHDFVIIEPEVSTGGLKMSIDNLINSGKVKSFGRGYYSEQGIFVPLTGLSEGDNVVFTQHLQIDLNGEKLYIVRWRDIIMVKNEDKA